MTGAQETDWGGKNIKLPPQKQYLIKNGLYNSDWLFLGEGFFFLTLICTHMDQLSSHMPLLSHSASWRWFSTIKPPAEATQHNIKNSQKKVTLVEKRAKRGLIIASASEGLWFLGARTDRGASWMWWWCWAHPALYNYRMSTLFMLSALTFLQC